MSVLIRGGRIITAADDYVADVYVEGERISLIGESLDLQADRVIDAAGKYVLPGCVDPHTHLDMPFGGTITIDDVESGQTAAAFGGTTCHVDFIIQPQGSTFADAIEEWRGKANGKQVIDMGYHMAVTDLRDGGSLEELASLPDQGITSYKLFMAYKGALMVDDETLFRTMEVAAETGALVMVHAENGDAIDVLVQEGARGRAHRAALARAHAAAGDGGRGDEPRDPAGARRRRAALRRPRLVQGVGRADRARPREGLGRLGRDLHAVLLRRLHVPRAAELRGREVRLHAAAAGEGEPGRPLERRADRRPLRDLHRPLRVPLGRAEDDGQGRLLQDPERRAGPREPAAHDPRVRRPRGADLAQPDGRAALHEPGEAVRALPAQGDDRGRLRRRHRRLRPGEASTRSPRPTSIRRRTTTSTRARG